MKKTSEIIIGLLAFTLLLVAISPVFNIHPETSVVYLGQRASLRTPCIEDVEALDSALSDLIYEDNYTISIKVNDSLKEAVVDYPSQLMVAKMKGTKLCLGMIPALKEKQGQKGTIYLEERKSVTDTTKYDGPVQLKVNIEMPSAMVHRMLRKPSSFRLSPCRLRLVGLQTENFVFRTNVGFVLDSCTIRSADIDVSPEDLSLSETTIGTLVLNVRGEGEQSFSSDILEWESVKVGHLILRGWSASTVRLDQHCYDHVTVEPDLGRALDVELNEIKDKMTLK